MRSSSFAAVAVVALCGAPLAALAQAGSAPAASDAPRPPPRDDAAATRLDRPVRVRATHRVDVIGPGERVETVLDRMRQTRAVPPAAEVKQVERPVLRAPDRAREAVDRANASSGEGQHGPRSAPGTTAGPPSDRHSR
jgi:hypothetical protein